MIARIALTAGMLVFYTLGINVYLYELFKVDFHHEYVLITYHILSLIMFLFIIFDIKAAFVNNWHKQLNWACILTVATNSLMIIFTHLTVLKNPIPLFYFFNGTVCFITGILMYCGWKYKTFKD